MDKNIKRETGRHIHYALWLWLGVFRFIDIHQHVFLETLHVYCIPENRRNKKKHIAKREKNEKLRIWCKVSLKQCGKF